MMSGGLGPVTMMASNSCVMKLIKPGKCQYTCKRYVPSAQGHLSYVRLPVRMPGFRALPIL